MVCVVQNGSSVRTSACRTARSTFWALAAGTAAKPAVSAMASPIPARSNFGFKLMTRPPEQLSSWAEYAGRSQGAQYA